MNGNEMYCLCCGEEEDVVDEVNRMKLDGWEEVGGIAIAGASFSDRDGDICGAWLFAQAMRLPQVAERREEDEETGVNGSHPLFLIGGGGVDEFNPDGTKRSLWSTGQGDRGCPFGFPVILMEVAGRKVEVFPGGLSFHMVAVDIKRGWMIVEEPAPEEASPGYKRLETDAKGRLRFYARPIFGNFHFDGYRESRTR